MQLCIQVVAILFVIFFVTHCKWFKAGKKTSNCDHSNSSYSWVEKSMTCCHLLEAQFKEQAKRHRKCTGFLCAVFKLIKLKLNMLFKSILFAWQHHNSRHCICIRMILFKYYKPMQLLLFSDLFLVIILCFCISMYQWSSCILYENELKKSVEWIADFSVRIFFWKYSFKILASFIFKCVHCKLLWIIEK